MLGYWRYRRLLRARNRAAALPAMVSPLPAASMPVSKAPLLALDIETTGLDASRDSIVSIGWVAIDAGCMHLDSSRHYLVEGTTGVGNSAVIHGIRDCDREHGGHLDHAMQALLQAAAGRVLVVHHAAMDMAFLQAACRAQWQCSWPVPVIDTLQWYRQRGLRSGAELKPGELRLANAATALGLPVRRGHDALADAISCGEVLLALTAGSKARLVDVVRCW